ncbi:3'-terminal phosphate cyclase, partial [Acinetobacter nosocomialis P020]|uniref:RHS repeat domain-containing protein n=1 Tax=Acinetobacter nosocomialis TaxID=106654 RepID=UPI000B57C5C7
PQHVQSGKYQFQIGSAGSTTLVLQTLLPVLLLQNEASELTISGTTWIVTDGKTLARESYTYDAAKKTGRLTSIQDNNGTNLVYSYDSTDRLISIKDNSSLNELI